MTTTLTKVSVLEYHPKISLLDLTLVTIRSIINLLVMSTSKSKITFYVILPLFL